MNLLTNLFGWFRFGGSALGENPGKQSGLPSATLVDGSSNIGTDLALQISAVWACVSRRATTIASLPLFVYTNEGGKRNLARDHRLWELLHESPNRRMTPYEFWVAMLMNHDMRGNAYARIDRNSRGEAISLWPMPADQVEVLLLNDGSMVYMYRTTDKQWALSEDSVLHLKDLGNGIVGLSKLEYMRATTTEAQSAQWQANRVFGSSGKPTGILMVDKLLKKEQRDQLRSQFSEMAVGNTARLFVLEADMKYQQLSLSPEDQQLLESRKFTVEEICRWFDVPPVLVHHSNVTTWGSGIEQIVDGFHKFTIRPMLVSIEQALRKRVMTAQERSGMTVEFSFDALLRASLKDRMEIYSKAVQNGVYNRNECRQLENQEPYEGGEVFTAQTNLAPLDMLGKLAAPPAPAKGPTDADKLRDAMSDARETKAEGVALTRHAELLTVLRNVKQSPPNITVNSAPVTVNQGATNIATPDVKAEFEMTMPESKSPDININMPEQPAPIVNVQASDVKNEITVQPAEVNVNLPPRRTDTTVTRDKDGNIVKAVQIEKDA